MCIDVAKTVYVEPPHVCTHILISYICMYCFGNLKYVVTANLLWARTYTYTHTHIYIHTHTYNIHTHTYIHTHTHTHSHTHAHMHTHSYLHAIPTHCNKRLVQLISLCGLTTPTLYYVSLFCCFLLLVVKYNQQNWFMLDY